jgi:hypothetical protein
LTAHYSRGPELVKESLIWLQTLHFLFFQYLHTIFILLPYLLFLSHAKISSAINTAFIKNEEKIKQNHKLHYLWSARHR